MLCLLLNSKMQKHHSPNETKSHQKKAKFLRRQLPWRECHDSQQLHTVTTKVPKAWSQTASSWSRYIDITERNTVLFQLLSQRISVFQFHPFSLPLFPTIFSQRLYDILLYHSCVYIWHLSSERHKYGTCWEAWSHTFQITWKFSKVINKMSLVLTEQSHVCNLVSGNSLLPL